MKKVNNNWVDDNNNSWNCDFYTEEQAEKHSKTLSNCSYCRNCSDCSDCRNCSIQPKQYLTDRIGSRKSVTNFYLNKGKIYVSCGCFSGNLVEFEKAVNKTHGDNEHGIAYKKEIEIVKKLWGKNEF